MADDDAQLMERLAALEAEVKADAAKKQVAKDAALVKLRAQKDEQQKLRDRQVALVTKKKPAPDPVDDDAGLEDIGGRPGKKSDLEGTLALARRANDMKDELAKTPGKGEKSWVKSGLASMLLGPLGWLYAGSFREAVPASAAWLVFAAIASHLPSLLLMPVLLVAMPLSGIVGAMYAVKYNRKSARQRIFGQSKKQEALAAGAPAKKR